MIHSFSRWFYSNWQEGLQTCNSWCAVKCSPAEQDISQVTFDPHQPQPLCFKVSLVPRGWNVSRPLYYYDYTRHFTTHTHCSTVTVIRCLVLHVQQLKSMQCCHPVQLCASSSCVTKREGSDTLSPSLSVPLMPNGCFAVFPAADQSVRGSTNTNVQYHCKITPANSLIVVLERHGGVWADFNN